MTQRKFKLWHSLVGILALVLIEGLLLKAMPYAYTNIAILCIAAIGAVSMLYVATEIVEEVRGTSKMLALLSALVAEFIVFFGFQYAYLLIRDYMSFPDLAFDVVSLALQSTMVFVFNPVYAAGTIEGKALLLINTLAALGLVLFILQNIWQIRSNKS